MTKSEENKGKLGGDGAGYLGKTAGPRELLEQ